MITTKISYPPRPHIPISIHYNSINATPYCLIHIYLSLYSSEYNEDNCKCYIVCYRSVAASGQESNEDNVVGEEVSLICNVIKSSIVVSL